MIREGKRAEVTNCKKAKTLGAVPAHTQSPQKGRVRDGYENVRIVKNAMVVEPDLQQTEKKAMIHFVHNAQSESIAAVTAIKMQESVPVRVQTVDEKSVPGERISMKKVHCKHAKEDITLDALFHSLNELN